MEYLPSQNPSKKERGPKVKGKSYTQEGKAGKKDRTISGKKVLLTDLSLVNMKLKNFLDSVITCQSIHVSSTHYR
jgi:hypothetical protein